MNLGLSLEELQLQHLPMRSFVHSIQLFAFDFLRSELKFPASYRKYRSASTYKEDPGAKTLSNAFEISKKTALTSRQASKDL